MFSSLSNRWNDLPVPCTILFSFVSLVVWMRNVPIVSGIRTLGTHLVALFRRCSLAWRSVSLGEAFGRLRPHPPSSLQFALCFGQRLRCKLYFPALLPACCLLSCSSSVMDSYPFGIVSPNTLFVLSEPFSPVVCDSNRKVTNPAS